MPSFRCWFKCSAIKSWSCSCLAWRSPLRSMIERVGFTPTPDPCCLSTDSHPSVRTHKFRYLTVCKHYIKHLRCKHVKSPVVQDCFNRRWSASSIKHSCLHEWQNGCSYLTSTTLYSLVSLRLIAVANNITAYDGPTIRAHKACQFLLLQKIV